MTDEERLDSEEDEDVEAHRRKVADEATETDEDDGEGDDVEAHRRR
jgi:hypothetical protein